MAGQVNAQKPTSEKEKLVDELGAVIQTLAHWVAYQRSRFPYSPVLEGGIVTELRGLLNGRKNCGIAFLEGEAADPGKRLDVVLAKSQKAGKVTSHLAVIEVKRDDSRGKIEQDVERVRKAGEKFKCAGFLLQVIEPKKTRKGLLFVESRRGKLELKKDRDMPFPGTKARRLKKALGSTGTSIPVLVVLVEVLP